MRTPGVAHRPIAPWHKQELPHEVNTVRELLIDLSFVAITLGSIALAAWWQWYCHTRFCKR